jgi:serine/threonine-protein kinase
MVMDATLSDPMVGRLLDGRYAVESFIAHGGMASVYLATDTRLERRVAVKILHAHLADDSETLARFEREARAAARLSHPNVVAVYDQGVEGTRPFLVMEFVPGVNLRHVLRDRGKLSVAEAVTVMDYVLAALSAAHVAGLIHRDIKPENVLLTADGRVKVADFGLARAIAGSTVTTTGSVLLGTAAYLSPEQFEHGTADARSDVYSAGVVFFELLTGSVPFQAESAYAVLHRHANEDVPAPSTRAADIPPQIDALVTWATARDPQERPEDASELHESLLDVKDRLNLISAVPPLPITATTRIAPTTATKVVGARNTDDLTRAMVGGGAPPPPAGRVGSSQPRRRRRTAIITAVLTLAVAVAAVLGWYFAEGRYTHVPKVVGKTEAAAVKNLHDSGLHVRFGPEVYSSKYKDGQVATESPSGGSRLTHGQTITLQLSQGGKPYTLPTGFRGSSVSDVTNQLKTAQISIAKTVQVYSTAVPSGSVVGTNPALGQTVHGGDSIDLRVSRGPAPVTIPNDLVNESEQTATNELQKLGLDVTPVERYDSTVAAGNVVRSHPSVGAHAHKGDTVTIVLSKGPKPKPVPGVVNDDIDSAVKTINNAGFHAHAVEVFPGGSGTVLQEKVNGQPWTSGETATPGTTVELDYY